MLADHDANQTCKSTAPEGAQCPSEELLEIGIATMVDHGCLAATGRSASSTAFWYVNGILLRASSLVPAFCICTSYSWSLSLEFIHTTQVLVATELHVPVQTKAAHIGGLHDVRDVVQCKLQQTPKCEHVSIQQLDTD